MSTTREIGVPASTAVAPEADGSGYTIENRLGGTAAPRYRRWQIETVRPYCGRSVLELGPGMGHFAAELHGLGLDRLVLGDAEAYALAHLEARFAGRGEIEVVELHVPGPIDIGEPVETIVAMNVIEHIEDDVEALRDLATALVPGGRIVVWVPGYPQLYGEFDRKVGHVRRHTPATMSATVRAAGLDVVTCRPLNLIGGDRVVACGPPRPGRLPEAATGLALRQHRDPDYPRPRARDSTPVRPDGVLRRRQAPREGRRSLRPATARCCDGGAATAGGRRRRALRVPAAVRTPTRWRLTPVPIAFRGRSRR